MSALGAALLICLAPTAIDGDTLRCGVSDHRIRLFGVDTPERGQRGYSTATKSLQSLIAETTLICRRKGLSYGRIVATCRNRKGLDLGREQLRRGHAKEVCSYSRNLYGTCR